MKPEWLSNLRKRQKLEQAVIRAAKSWFKHWEDGSISDFRMGEHPADRRLAKSVKSLISYEAK